MKDPLTQYIRTFRKRAGLSQVEVAILMGNEDAAAEMGRHERSHRLPPLKTALAYAIILRIPVERLFEGLHSEIGRDVVSRIEGLRESILGERPSAMADCKLRHISEIVEDVRRRQGRDSVPENTGD